MARVCDICGKRPMFGNAVSHSNRKTRRKFIPNLKYVRILVKGLRKRIRICTRCIKTGKIKKAA